VKLRRGQTSRRTWTGASRERAQALILAGKVLVDDQKMTKLALRSRRSFDSMAWRRSEVRQPRRAQTGARLDHWQIDVTGKVCLDVGASIGGFTDCLLQRGAERVIAVDPAMARWISTPTRSSRSLNRKTNARYLTRDAIENTLIDRDGVSFISLRCPSRVISSAFSEQQMSGPDRHLIVWLSPSSKRQGIVGKGGIVRDEAAQLAAVERVEGGRIKSWRYTDRCHGVSIRREGNREFLLHGIF